MGIDTTNAPFDDGDFAQHAAGLRKALEKIYLQNLGVIE